MKRLPKNGKCHLPRVGHAPAWRALSIAVLAQAALTYAAPAAGQTESSEAGSTGMSVARLARLNQVFDTAVEQDQLQGAVLTVLRDGKPVMTKAFGHLDSSRLRGMPVNAVFDLSTLTQPVTVAAAISWQEQGGWLLTDRLGQHLPPFERQQATLWDVMRQVDGFANAINPFDREPGQRIRPSQRWRHSLEAALSITGDSFVRQVARQSIAYAPGAVARPGFSFDLLGMALEKSSQQTLGTFFLRNLFIPLDMWDTGFNPPAELETRLVGRQTNSAGDPNNAPIRNPRDPVIFECGGACLTGTATDYAKFAQMLLRGGRVGQQQVLSRLSVQMMTRHQLATATSNDLPALIDTDALQVASRRSGLGLALVPDAVPLPLPLQPGDFGARAANGSFFWVSPRERLVVVVLAIQRNGQNSARLSQQVIGLIGQSIID